MATKKAPAAKKATAPKAAALNMALLAQIVAATNSEAGFLYTAPADHAPLLEKGFVELNAQMVDGNGNIATRATEDGANAVGQSASDAAAAPVATKARPTFEVDTDVEMPAQRRFGSNPGIYPFDTMAVNSSFFVPSTEDRPNVAKSMASTISSANKRYKNEDGTYSRKFSVRNVEKDVKTGVAGARIFRTQ